jgi:inosine-uridine nucleoside N-ribohydrolase
MQWDRREGTSIAFSVGMKKYKKQMTICIMLALLVGVRQAEAKRGEGWERNLPRNPSFWIDTDIGFDSDDCVAHVVAAMRFGSKIKGISTSLYDPKGKAKLSKLLLSKLGLSRVPVYAGIGFKPEKGATEAASVEAFRRKYPGWPPQFGQPYQGQGAAYKEQFGAQLSRQRVKGNAVDALIRAANDSNGSLVVVALGPLTNLAAAIKKEPGIVSKIDRVVVMGGWFEKEGQISRMGYNTIMDLDAAKTVFGNKKLKVLLVNSQAIKDARIIVDRNREFEYLQGRGGKNRLSRALYGDMARWVTHSRNTMGDIALADPVTALLAAQPFRIKRTERATIDVIPDREVHMMDSRAAGLIKVRPAREGNVSIVRQIKKPSKVRRMIVGDLFSVGFPSKKTVASKFRGLKAKRWFRNRPPSTSRRERNRAAAPGRRR